MASRGHLDKTWSLELDQSPYIPFPSTPVDVSWEHGTGMSSLAMAGHLKDHPNIILPFGTWQNSLESSAADARWLLLLSGAPHHLSPFRDSLASGRWRGTQTGNSSYLTLKPFSCS
jgi:hypothetical protein